MHILISSGISLAPWRALALRSSFPPVSPLQVVVKGDHTAIQTQESKWKKERGGRKKNQAQVSQEKTWESVRGWFNVCQFPQEKSIYQTPSHLFLHVFFKGRYIRN